jgi:hypothetical protein
MNHPSQMYICITYDKVFCKWLIDMVLYEFEILNL